MLLSLFACHCCCCCVLLMLSTMLLLLSLLLLLLLQSQMLLLRPLQGGRGGGADLDVHRSTRGGTDRRLQRDAAAGEAAIPWCPEAGFDVKACTWASKPADCTCHVMSHMIRSLVGM